MRRSRWIHALLLLALLATSLALFSHRAQAIQDSEDKVWFGPVGITPGDRVRVNVYVIGNPDTVGNPNDLPWTFVVRFFNRGGRMVQERRLQLATGVTGTVEFAIQDEVNFPLESLGRRTLRAEIVGFNPQPDPPRWYATTFEVFSGANGRTSLLLGGPDTLPAATVVPPPGQ